MGNGGRWDHTIYAKPIKEHPERFICVDDEKFTYINTNSKCSFGQDDQGIQIVQILFPKIPREDIVRDYVGDKIKYGIMRPDASFDVRFIKKYVNLKKVDKPILAEGCFLQDWGNVTWVIVRMGSQVELYNAKERKFYGCHVIRSNQKVSECLAIEGK